MEQDISSLPEHFQHYIHLVKETDIHTALEQQSPKDFAFFQSLSEEQSTISYATDKWTIKEVLQHLIDSERIFGYRALALSRKEENELPGFDENHYVKNSHANKRKWSSLISEYQMVRKGSIALVESLDKNDLNESGQIAGQNISTEAMLSTMVGHVMHHIGIIKDRYLNHPEKRTKI